MKKIFPVALSGALCVAFAMPSLAANFDNGCTITTTDDCDPAAINVQNPVRNSSFEVGVSTTANGGATWGMDGWGIVRGEPLKSAALTGIDADHSTAAPTSPSYSAPVWSAAVAGTGMVGSKCLRIDNPNGGAWRLLSREFQVEPGQKYVVALSAKADTQLQISVNMEYDDGSLETAGAIQGAYVQVLNPNNTSLNRYIAKGPTSDTDPTRITKIFTVPSGHNHANLSIECGNYDAVPKGSNVWLDAVQVLKVPSNTTSANFVDPGYNGRPLDLGIVSGRPYTTSVSNDVPVTLQVRNNQTTTNNVVIRYGIIDEYYNKVVAQGTTAVFSATAGQTVSAPAISNVALTVNNNLTAGQQKKRGKYIFAAQLVVSDASSALNGKVIDHTQWDFAVIDSVKKTSGQYTEAFSVSNTVTQEGADALGPRGISRDIWSCWGASPEDFFDFTAEAGDRWMRTWDFNWGSIEPVAGQYNFTLADALVDKAAARGIQIMPCLGTDFIVGDQGWELPQHVLDTGTLKARTWVPGTVCLPDVTKWTNYVTACVNHYKSRTNGIHTWEVLNEPQGWMSASDYAIYLKAAYNAIKTADPTARVASFTASQDYGQDVFAYLTQCFTQTDSLINYADVVSFHPYTAKLDWSSPIAQDSFNFGLRNFVNQYGGATKPLWVGELYQLVPSVQGVDDDYLSRNMKGHELARRYLTDLGTGVGRSFTVTQMNYMKPFNPTSTTMRDFRYAGMYPSTQFVVYNTLTKFFEGAGAEAEVSVGAKCKLYRYTKPGDVPVAAAWSFDDRNAPTQLKITGAAGKLLVYDVMGNPSDKAQTSGSDMYLTLTNSPLYIQPASGIAATTFRDALSPTNVGTALAYPISFPGNPSFEAQMLNVAGGYVGTWGITSASIWTFATTSGNAGLQQNGSAYSKSGSTFSNAPADVQTAFLQGQGSTVKQTITLPAAGTYNLTYWGAQRPFNNTGNQTIKATVGVPGTTTYYVTDNWTPSGATYASRTTGNFTVTASTRTVEIKFESQTPGDCTAFLDYVSFKRVS